MLHYFYNVLVAIDQLGNAICGGNPDNTISARVGYFSLTAELFKRKSNTYWKIIESIINFTFYPVDKENHCLQAFEADPIEVFNDNDGDVFRGILCVIIVFVCIPLSALLYTIWAINRLYRLVF